MRAFRLGIAQALAVAMTGTAFVSAAAHEIDLTRLPVGDGKISDGPKTGWIWACRIDPGAGGAQKEGPWFNGDGTYDLTAKAIVPGNVKWPSKLKIERRGDRRVFSGNDLPKHGTGTFPVGRDTEAFKYDRNPNRIREQAIAFDLPADPVLAGEPQCAPGAVGILLSGSVLFNALDAPGRDAVAHETQDKCQGHPQESGVYHYHSISSCADAKTLPDGHSALVGYSLDGFGIYGHLGEDGKALASADLDECHGHSHAIEWDGKMVEMYHYHATWDFPYTVGCLRGDYDRDVVMAISGPPPGGVGPQGGPPGGPPDLKAAAAKLGISMSKLRSALGPPPPNLAKTARKLGISEDNLREALGVP